MNIKVFAEMVLENGRTLAARKLHEYMKYRYGKRADVCVVSAAEGQVVYSTTAINGVESSDIDGEKLCRLIRVKCGQQMLNTYGLTVPGKDVPVLALLPTPALVKAIGIVNFIKFLRAWSGDSKVGEAIVVRYILWKEDQDGLSN